MGREFVRNNIALLLVAVGYFFVYTNLVGIAAATPFPDWYVSFARDNKALSLVLLILVTTVPAAAALFAGYIMAKLITRHHLWYGIAIVICVTVYAVISSNVGVAFVEEFALFVLPSNVIQVPLTLAWWLFLSLAALYFSRRYAND